MANPASVAEFLESEHVLSSQFFASAADTDTPERALMRAVLKLALADLTDPKLINRCSARGLTKMQRQAAEWFTSEDDSYLYSFISICQALNLDAGALRRALLPPERKAA
jgi:predicted ATPase